jgi:cytochrome c-type biogenesis protein
MSVLTLVQSGPLLLAIPVAAAAGAVTFLSPCCLPLVPGYLAYITGMSGADAATAVAADDAEAAEEALTPAAVTAAGGTGPGGAVTGGTGPGSTVTGSTGAAGGARAAGSGPAGRGADGRLADRSRAAAPSTGRHTGRTVAGTALFVVGFSTVFALAGLAVGGLGQLFNGHDATITRVLGGVTILLGLLFFGAFDRFMFAGRVFKPSVMPKAGLAGAPLLGVLFGIGWTPCIGPTLTAVLLLSAQSGTAARGAFLAFVYGLGLGIPFLIVALAFTRVVNLLGFFKRNARMVSRIGGVMLIAVGLLEVTGGWTSAIVWMHTHWFSSYNLPL